MLPIEFWECDLVLGIAVRAGRPIAIDVCTAELLRGGRVCQNMC